MHVYNNLLHSQYLYDAIYQDENCYQNLSYLDGGMGGHSPVGVLSSTVSSSVTGLSIAGNIGTSINQTISNTLKAKKSSIFKFQNSSKRKCAISEITGFTANPLMSVD